jgi:3-oxoacyl-[acyl-carrier protein] reductase
MFSLNGKNALITGASGGIGSAIARALHAQGATVVLSGTREAPLAVFAGELGERAHVALADLSDPTAPDRLVTAAEAAAGPLQILVNNAGMWRDNLGVRMKDAEWDQVLEVNLSAPFRLARAVMRGMIRRRSGRIINIGSLSGTIGNPGQANYSAAKAGLMGFSKALAYEVATRGITVNVVAPGFIGTPMVQELAHSLGDKIMGRIPLGRMGTADEIAAGVVYLASDEAAYITGTTLHINGGMSMI